MLKKHGEIFLLNCIYKTNKFKMFLCIMIETTSLNITFYIEFCFMFEKNSENYLGLFQQLTLLYFHVDVFQSNVIITDDEKTLINEIRRIFFKANSFLCRGHINKNVIKNCKKTFCNNYPGITPEGYRI